MQNVAPGVTYREGRYHGSRYHLVQVDRERAEVEPRPYRTGEAAGETVTGIDRRTGSVASLNGTFFDPSRPGRRIFGEVKAPEGEHRPVMVKKRSYWVVTPEGSYEMGETVPVPGTSRYEMPLPAWQSARYVLGGGGRLVRNGVRASLGAGENDQGFLPDVLARRNRSALGFTDDDLWLVAVDPPGWTPRETADFFVHLGADQAMFLDGGGSTEMVVGDRAVNHLSAGRERPMPTAIVMA